MPVAIRVIDRLDELAGDVQLTGVAQGDMLYRGASKWNNLAAGAAGRFLKTQGAGAGPIWSEVDHGALTGLGADDHNQYLLNVPSSSTRNVIQPALSTVKPLVIQGAASQSANLTEWQDSAGTILARISANGQLGLGTAPALKCHIYNSTGGINLIRAEVGDSLGVLVSIRNIDREWFFGINSSEQFIIRDGTGGNVDVMRLEPGAPLNSIYITAAGLVGIGTSGPGATLGILCGAAANKGLLVKAAASQSANLMEVQNSAASILFAVEADGDIRTSRASSGTTLGNVTNKLPLYNASGTLLGYIPIYDSIT
jgi:hypothetical protein